MAANVLVVDDDQDFRGLVTVYLQTDPLVGAVIEAGNGVAALNLMRQEQAQVVVTDVMMPWLDGLQTTRLIKQEWPNTRVVVMSSLADEAYQRAAYASGADAFLNKRDISTLLLLVVRSLILGGAQGGEQLGAEPGPSGHATPSPRPEDAPPGHCQSAPS